MSARGDRGPRAKPAPELLAELDGTPWMYEYELAPGLKTTQHNSALNAIHDTRAELIEAAARDALEAAGPNARALDIACNEGWFSQRLLDWGANTVLGVDVRESNIRRATLVRDHFGIPGERLRFEQADVFDLDPRELGQFDVVLMLGLIYHLEDPVGALRIARALTGSLCAIESQLTRQYRPIVHMFGSLAVTYKQSGSFAVMIERDFDVNRLASTGGTLSLIPNRAAFEQSVQAAGFRDVRFAAVAPDQDDQYVIGDRAVIIARGGPEPDFAPPPVEQGAGDLPEILAPELSGEDLDDTLRATIPPDFKLANARALDLARNGAGWLERLGAGVTTSSLREHPPLDHAPGSFDLIWAGSAFARLDESWSGWMVEMHRLLTPGGLVLATFLGQGAASASPLLSDWDDGATGMCVLRADSDQPVVYHSTWWIRAHWGRAFEILNLVREGIGDGPGRGLGLAVMRRREAQITASGLELPEPGEPREATAWRRQLELLEREERLAGQQRERELRRLRKLIEGARQAADAGSAVARPGDQS